MSRFVNVAGSPVRLDRLTNPRPSLRSLSVSVTSGSTANTPGAWVEVLASTPMETNWVQILSISGTLLSNNSSAMLMDIGIGPSGSETVVVESLQAGFRGTGRNLLADLPCPVPAGSRVAMRIAGESTRTSHVSTWDVLLGVSDIPVVPPITIGANVATSTGTVLDNPTLGVKGAWVELSAAVPVDLMGLHLGPAFSGGAAAAISDGLIDIGIGPSGSEAVVVENFLWSSTSSENVTLQPPLVSCQIPAGSRVAARYQRYGTLRCDLILHGVPA